MAHGIKSVFDCIERISEKAGKAASYLVFFMMVVTAIEVVARYVFNRPTVWVWPVNRQLFGLFILVAGIYAMATGGHIRIEILHDRFPSRLRLIAKVIALIAFISFMGVLVWQGAWMGWNSLMTRELMAGAFRIPLYPFKLLIPIGAFLFLLQGILAFFRRDD